VKFYAVFGVLTPAVGYVNGRMAYISVASGEPHATFWFLSLFISVVFRNRGGLLMAWKIAIFIINEYFLF
jgi:hypothetical protein